MRILHIMTSQGGGAGIAAVRLQQQQRAMGLHADVLSTAGVHNPSQGLFVANTKTLRPKGHAIYRLLAKMGLMVYAPISVRNNTRLLGETASQMEIFTHPYSEIAWHEHPLVQQADILHLHWIANMLDLPTFFQHINKPVVWTLHDTNPFRGGCHFQGDSTILSTVLPQLEQEYLQVKKSAYLAHPALHVVHPSAWMGHAAKSSGVFPEQTSYYHIPNGIPMINRQESRQAIRQRLGIQNERPVWLFIAEKLSNQYKGFDILLDALMSLPIGCAQLLAIGKPNEQIPDILRPHIQFTGPISDYNLLADYYYAADAFLLPSREDNLPNVMLEALSQGTPVIATPAGGIPEVVKHMENGLLATDISAQGLQIALQTFLENPTYFDRSSIQADMQARFTLPLQVNRYHQLYERLTT